MFTCFLLFFFAFKLIEICTKLPPMRFLQYVFTTPAPHIFIISSSDFHDSEIQDLEYLFTLPCLPRFVEQIYFLHVLQTKMHVLSRNMHALSWVFSSTQVRIVWESCYKLLLELIEEKPSTNLVQMDRELHKFFLFVSLVCLVFVCLWIRRL